MLEEELEVQAHESPEPLFGIVEFRQRFACGGQQHLKGVALDEVEQLLLAAEVVVEPRQAYVGGA